MKHLLICFLLMLQTTVLVAQLSEKSEVYLLTCEVGDEIWSQFGHSAIRIKDPASGIDQTYNWGMFEFGDDEFEFNMKFAQGRLDYYMAIQPTGQFLYEYQYYQREVRQQLLNLTLEEKNALWNALEQNYLPENRFYKYDFFFDNCASRIRDIFKQVLGDRLQFAQHSDAGQLTYREIIDKGFLDFPWTDFGIDLVLGFRIDARVENENLMFNPFYMEKIFEDSKIVTASGTQNFVLSNERIVAGTERSNEPDTSFLPFVLAIILLVITALLSFFKLQMLAKIWSTLLFLMLGLLGVLLLFMWFGTDHLASKGNLNLIWANPLWLILMVTIWVKKWHLKSRKIYFVTAFIMFGLVLFFMMLPQEFHLAARIIIITLAIQFYFLSKDVILQTKKEEA